MTLTYDNAEKILKKYPSFLVEIYNYKVHVVFDDNWQEIQKELLRACGYNGLIPATTKYTHGSTTSIFSGLLNASVMFFNKGGTLEVICHECMHVIINILDTVGIPANISTSEPLAYLLSFIFRKTMEIKEI